MLTLTTRDGDIDLLVDPPGSPGYAALKRIARDRTPADAAEDVSGIRDLAPGDAAARL